MSERAGASDAGSALSRDSIGNGAVVSHSGDALVVTGGAIVEAASSRLIGPSASKDRGDRWLVDHVPAFFRGQAWVVPLFSAPSAPDGDEGAQQTLDARASELGQSIMSACWFSHGDPTSLDLSGNGGNRYAAELVRTGAKDATWWAVGNGALVLVYYGEPSPKPKSRMALHVVPISWVSARSSSSAKKVSIPDLAWTWADVVAFAEAHSSGRLHG